MRHPIRSRFVLPALVLAGSACAGEPEASPTGEEEAGPTSALLRSFEYDTAAATSYVAEIWDTDEAGHAAVVEGAGGDGPEPTGARGGLVLDANHGGRVVRLTRWDDSEGAVGYARAAREEEPAPRFVHELRLRSIGHEPDQPLVFEASSFAQYSQFVMRRREAVDTLQALAAGMSGGMVLGEPTMQLISTLTSADSSVVAFLGIWDNPDGFELFAEQNTFGEEPYWAPYAENEHDMMSVVSAWTRR